MKTRELVLICGLLAATFPSLSSAATCKPSDPAGTLCKLHVTKVRPTQFSVGAVAVTCKAAKLSSRSKKKLKKYLRGNKRLVPVVVAPDGEFYMTDHHHLSTALYQARSSKWDDDDKVLSIEVLENHAGGDVAWGEFWDAMLKQHNSYDFDNKGIANMSFALLPRDAGRMLNDPYRTLSRWVRESCGYIKQGKEQCDGIRTDHPHEAPFFMEFYWGELFRQHLPLPTADLPVCKSIPYSATCLDDEVSALKAIYEPAMKLAASEAAKKFFEDQGLSPWAYGYNPSGKHLELTWSGPDNACEEPVTE